MKKILLSLGTLAVTTMPVAAIVSCSLTKTKKDSSKQTIEKQKEAISKLQKQALQDLKDKEESKVLAYMIQKDSKKLTQDEVADILGKIRKTQSVEELMETVMDMLTKDGNGISKVLTQDLVNTATKAKADLKEDTEKLKSQQTIDEMKPKNNQPVNAKTPSSEKPTPLNPGQKTKLTHYHVDKAVLGEQTKAITLTQGATKILAAEIQKSIDEQNAFQITNVGTTRDYYKLPNKLILNGNSAKAQVHNFRAPQGTTLEFFKMSGANLSAISPGVDFSISSKDRVVMVIKKGNQWVNGKSYEPMFASIPDQFSSFQDDGFGDAIRNNTFDINSITDFVNSKLLPGETYTSSLAGQTTSMLMPKLDPSLRPIDAKDGSSGKAIYSPYIDASMAQGAFDQADANIEYVAKKYESVTMAFMQNGGSESGNGSGSWGGNVALDSDGANSYRKLMNAMRENGHDFIVSFGGVTGSPIWKKADPVLLAGFLSNFAEQYNINTFDYDIEGGEVADTKAVNSLSLATAIAQKALARKGRTLNINLTIPSETDGLAPAGETVLKSFISSGVDVNILNGMAMMMNKGITEKSGGLAGVYRQHTIDGLESQLKTAYDESGLAISDETLYGKLGVTFDISTDTWPAEQMHSDADLTKLRKTFDDKKIGFIGYWSLNNDDDAVNGLGAPTFGTGKAYTHLHSYSNGRGSIPHVTNPKTNDFTKKAFASYYSNDIEGSSVFKDEVILPVGNTDPIHGGTKIKGIDPDDGTVHIYEAVFYASSSERPEHPQTPGQFKDLGPVDSGVGTNPAVGTLLSKFSPFSVKGNTDGGGSAITKLFSTGTSSNIKAYDEKLAYNKVRTLVFYKGAFWTNSWYANPGELNKPGGPWNKLS